MKNEKQLRTISDQYLMRLAKGEENVVDFKIYMQVIAQKQAEKSHEAWCERKRADGYIYGKEIDDEKKTTNLLVPFEELPDHYKEANIKNAMATLEIMFSKGYVVGTVVTDAERELMIAQMAEELHNRWVMNKMEAGYRFGLKRNDDKTKGELTHRDMLPMAELLEMFPDDAEYDYDTARGIIDDMMASGMVITKMAM